MILERHRVEYRRTGEEARDHMTNALKGWVETSAGGLGAQVNAELRQTGSQALDLGRRAWVLNLRVVACGPSAALPRRAVRGIVRHPGSGVTGKGSPIVNDIMSGVRGPANYRWLQGPANVRERDPRR